MIVKEEEEEQWRTILKELTMLLSVQSVFVGVTLWTWKAIWILTIEEDHHEECAFLDEWVIQSWSSSIILFLHELVSDLIISELSLDSVTSLFQSIVYNRELLLLEEVIVSDPDHYRRTLDQY